MTTVSPTIQAMVDRGFECWNSGNLDDMRDMYAEDAEVDQRYAILYETRESDGKIVRAKLYPDAATAQAAAGEVSADAAS